MANKLKPLYSVDDKVSFELNSGEKHTGKVTQVSKKTYFVMVESDVDGKEYSVHENAVKPA